VIEVGLCFTLVLRRCCKSGARFLGFFQRALAIIPPHQQLFHEALFNKFDLPKSFSQKNNGRVSWIALMPTSIGIALLHDWEYA
jgi:hypothetical protein